MTFDMALCKMREGGRVRRKHWNESCYLRIVLPAEITRTKAKGHDFNKRRPIVMSVSGRNRAWSPTQTEILANDWMAV